jgi:predicted ATPase/DNA-binding NarL/FixJ family response regulator/transcriptional regulator with XRE-family HTH domain
MDEFTHSFGARLRQYRLRAGLTQEALAERSGLTSSAIAALERNRRRHPYPHTLRLLATALALSNDELAQFNLLAMAGHRDTITSEPPLPQEARRTNLPAPRTSLIGRESATAALVDLIPRHVGRLVTLTGIGGGGKTRLALAVAAELQDAFAHGVWLVELAASRDPALIPQVVAATLGLPDVAGTPLLERLVQTLRTRTLLLVLDNCEHLSAACADFCEQLLATCPDLRILATSREPLQVTGERQWRVPTLALPDPDQPLPIAELALCPAVQLFVDRARSVDPAFSLTEHNSEAIVDVCTRLGGIPLTLELAAARVRVLTVAQILERLDDSLRLLGGNSRAAPTRHQTLRTTLAWSHDLLSPSEQTLFHRLAVFVDGCDIAAVEAICAGPNLQVIDMLDLLTQLVDKSLLLVEAEAEAARYRLLEPVRQYASGMGVAGEREAAQARHAAWYLALAERAAQQLRGPAQAAWLARLERELGNLRAALQWATSRAEAETEARLVLALTPFWEARTHLSEGRQALAAVLARPATCLNPALRRRVLIAAGGLAQWQADLDGATVLLNESLTAARAAADRHGIADALAGLGTVQMRRTASAEAADLLEESLARYRDLKDDAGIAWVLLVLGTTRGNQGDNRRARALLEECLRLFRRQGDVRRIAMARTMLAMVYQQLDDRDRAATLLKEALPGHLQVSDWVFLVQAIRRSAAIAAEQRPRQAARLLGAAEGLRDHLGAVSPPTDRQTDEQVIAMIRAQLTAADLAVARAEGRALTLDQAVAEALASTEPTGQPALVLETPLPTAALESLTPRERDVARLLARGYADRQIAAALAIAVSTAGVHVHHILNKLNLRSRWQVAGWMAEHDASAPVLPGADRDHPTEMS